jgi:hypothetical protein
MSTLVSRLLSVPLTELEHFRLATIESQYERLILTHRFSAPLLFPLLDSFPASIFNVGAGEAKKLAVHAGLTTSTAVAGQVRAVEQIVRRMHMVTLGEREALCNGLQSMAEEYDEGWDSGSDSEDDD